MKNLKTHIGLIALLFSLTMVAQSPKDEKVTKSVKFSLFEPEDSIGTLVFRTLDNFEHFGHFGEIESGLKNGNFITKYMALFEPYAMMLDDLSDTIVKKEQVNKSQYEKLARKSGYQPYILFIEKSDSTVAVKQDSASFYTTRIRFFKLFKDKAIIGDTCLHGAIYSVGLKIYEDTALVKITDVRLEENGDHHRFYLGNYGRHIYSPILVSNKLESLIVPFPPRYKPTSQPSKSNIFLHVGYISTNYMQPEAMRNNLNAAYAFSGNESGRSAGIKYQKTYGRRGIFGLFFGVEYEENTYDFTHTNASFIYTEDQDGNQLIDLEGWEYDKKYVDVASYQEEGNITYVKPEVGLLFNLGGKVVNFQILGSVGNAFLMTKTYQANSIVSYQGEIDAIGVPISNEALGFYTDLEKTFEGDLSQAQNYMFYKAGAGIDFIISQRIGLSLLVEYRESFTYAFRKHNTDLMFLNPDTEAGYSSQLNTLSDSRLYNGLSLQAGIKIYLNELR